MKIIIISVIAMMLTVFAVAATPSMDNPSFDVDDPLNPIVPLHEWRTLGNGGLNGYQYDIDGNLMYLVKGVPGVAKELTMLPNGHHRFLIESDTIPNNAKFKNGFVHFHPAANQDETQDGIEGFFLKHTAVTSGFEFPAGRMVMKQGIDFGFPNNYLII